MNIDIAHYGPPAAGPTHSSGEGRSFQTLLPSTAQHFSISTFNSTLSTAFHILYFIFTTSVFLYLLPITLATNYKQFEFQIEFLHCTVVTNVFLILSLAKLGPRVNYSVLITWYLYQLNSMSVYSWFEWSPRHHSVFILFSYFYR